MNQITQKFTLHPTEKPAIEFSGERVIQLEGHDRDGQTGGRRHDIRVYRSDEFGLFVEVAYQTAASGETPQCQVEFADDVDEVDAILSLYEPSEFIIMEPGPARKRVVDTVTWRYDSQVNDVMATLSEEPAPMPANKPK